MRSIARWVSGMAILMGLLIQPGIAEASATPARPDIVVILTDDQGWGDLSISGNKALDTPNIDRLAREGANFDRLYVSPVCSPTRVEFLTGRHHIRSGVYDTSEGGERVNPDEKMIGQFFRDAGYRTGAFGKWHSGMQYPDHPEMADDAIDHTRAALAMCENIDWNVGRIMAKFDELGIADNTNVIYFSDNGPNGNRFNGGMRGRKGSIDEGGVRSPFFLRWPAKVKAGTAVPQLCHVMDMLPTLAETLSGKIVEAHDPPIIGMEHDRSERTESYVKDFKRMTLGTIRLVKGPGTLTLKAVDISGESVMDFRLMLLTRID